MDRIFKNLKRTEDGNMASNLNTAMNARRKWIHVQLVYVHLYQIKIARVKFVLWDSNLLTLVKFDWWAFSWSFDIKSHMHWNRRGWSFVNLIFKKNWNEFYLEKKVSQFFMKFGHFNKFKINFVTFLSRFFVTVKNSFKEM